MASPEYLLDVVNLSPKAVAAQSKAQWLDAFDPKATVEDPTGSPTHTGRESLEVFHTSLIEPHTITFDIQRDFVDTECNRVTRLTDIHIAYFKNSYLVGQIQPAHLVYDVDEKSGRLTSLRANWEIVQARMMGNHLLAKLFSFVMMLIAPFVPLVLNFGVSFSAIYSSSFFVGPTLSGGKHLNGKLLKAVSNHSKSSFEALFENPTAACVQVGKSQLTPGEAFDRMATDTAKFRLVRPAATATHRTACWFERETTQGRVTQGVYHFESKKTSLFDTHPTISSMYLFEDSK
ncbi:hypothetical protein BASA81_006867 [Batrachochytrium salamandrivorans]|nr:hypothetical protein BASA81_006867 [Batrachochytrium salamandrivorans]